MSSLPDASSASSTSTPAPQGCFGVREGVLELGPFQLHFGGNLGGVRVAWKLAGNTSGPVVVALGGISAGRHVASDATKKGWWHEVVGPGLALDTDRVQVLGMDFLGGSCDTTGPQRGERNFPSISAYDQAEVLKQLLDHLQISQLPLLVGASYGGMVGLAFAERFASRVRRIVVISAAHRTHPMSTAWRSVQRAIVREAAERGNGPDGLRLARALAMATYRSSDEFAQRFAGEAQRVDGRFEFPVERYLLSRGDAYAATYVPEAFVCLSESIDLHRVDPAKIQVPVTLVGVREDQLVPIEDMRQLSQSLAGQSDLIELSSLYGHDAFLKEGAALKSVFSKALTV